MKAAIIGYGKMGREIEKILRERGHEVGAVVDAGGAWDDVRACDVALEFTTPETAYENIRRCIDLGVAVLSGTTGWGNTVISDKWDRRTNEDRDHLRAMPREEEELTKEREQRSLANYAERRGRSQAERRQDERSEVKVESETALQAMRRYCLEKGGAMFYASNYCLGVNLMFRLNRQLAQMVAKVGGGYGVSIEEVHHIHKKDAPSGTALTLKEDLMLHAACLMLNDIPITSIREGEVPGIHTVRYESADEVLELRHEIKNRRTLALGAVVAAEFLCGKKGIYSMDDLF